MKKSLKNLVVGGLMTLGSLGFSSCTEDVVEPETQEPYIEQPAPTEERSIRLSGDVVDYTNFQYDAKLNNVSKANLSLYKDGSEMASKSRSIDSKNMFGVYSNLLKGDYTLKAKSDSLEASKNFKIPDYKMSANLDGLDDEVKYDSEINWNLEGKLEDKNIEDTVKIESINSLDNKLDVSVDGYNVNIKPHQGVSGQSELEIRLKSGSETLTKNISVNIEGEPSPEYKFVVNPFIQPNQENLQWYGSGDVNSDNVVNQNDYNAIFGSSKDEADIDGDGVPGTLADKSLLGNKLNGSIPYLPGEWDKLQTREERVDWRSKMLSRDKTDETGYGPGFTCQSFASQVALNFHGFPELGHDSDKGLKDNGRFNIPVYYASISTLDGGHAINATLVGDDIANFNDWYFIEPQNDKQVLPGGWYMPEGKDIEIFYAYVNQHGNFNNFRMVTFNIENGVPVFKGFTDRTDVKVIKTRQESNELVN